MNIIEGREAEVPYVLSEEQESFRTSLRRFMEAHSSEDAVRSLAESDTGFDAGVWRQMAEQLGLQAIVIPEEHGGFGLGQRDLALVFEEMGRVLYSGPYFATVALAANALAASGDQAACAEYLPGIAAGERTATLAFTEDDGDWDATRITTQATAVGDGAYHVDGVKNFVLDGAVADLLLVLADTDHGASLFAVDASSAGDSLARRELPRLDLTRRQARVELTAAPATLVGELGAGRDIVASTHVLASVALAAEQLGGTQTCLDMAVDYGKQRVQFGRPIGSFQAIKHKCAQMSLRLEAARSAVLYAAWCADQDPGSLAEEASIAQSYCSETYSYAAAEMLQIHGGIGFTWEHAAHLHLRRAKSSELFLGDGRYHRERVLQHVGV